MKDKDGRIRLWIGQRTIDMVMEEAERQGVTPSHIVRDILDNHYKARRGHKERRDEETKE